MSDFSEKKIIRTDPLEVTPHFSLPPGLDEGSYIMDNEGGDEGESEGEDFEVSSIEESDDTSNTNEYQESSMDYSSSDSGNDTQNLGTPTNVTITSQTVRTTPDGKQVVDVVINVPDIEGAENYEVRISKN